MDKTSNCGSPSDQRTDTDETAFLSSQISWGGDGMAEMLIGGMSVTAFDRDIRERYFRKFAGAFDEDAVVRLFDLPSLERLLEDASLLAYVDIYAAGHLKRLADMQYKSGMSGLNVAAGCLREGQTVRVRNVDRFDQRLSAFVAEVGQGFAARAQANLYLTPPRSDGFPAHFDITDVFVLQLRGAKDWKIYPEYSNQKELPLPSVDWNPNLYRPGEHCEAFNLRTGDVLYLPRGVMHAAACSGQESMHLTIAIEPPTCADFLFKVLELSISADVELRRRVALSDRSTEEELAKLAETLRTRARNALDSADLLSLLRQERDGLIPEGRTPTYPRLESAIADLLSAWDTNTP